MKMKDINPQALTLGMNEASKLLNKQLERGKIDGTRLASVLASIQPTLDYSGFDRADVEVDALLEAVCEPKRVFSDEEIANRMMLPMLNEVVRCLEENIIASPAEADMALVYGLGFPPFRGGAFRYMDTLGISNVVDQAKRYLALGPLYALPELLVQKAHQHQSWYPVAQPIDAAALQTA